MKRLIIGVMALACLSGCKYHITDKPEQNESPIISYKCVNADVANDTYLFSLNTATNRLLTGKGDNVITLPSADNTEYTGNDAAYRFKVDVQGEIASILIVDNFEVKEPTPEHINLYSCEKMKVTK